MHALRTAACLVTACSACATHAAVTTTRTELARSPEGRPIEVITLAESAADPAGRTADQRPALCIVAGVQGNHTIGIDIANALIDRLATDHAALFATHTVYIIPSFNPDAAARFADAARYRADSGRASEPADADRDRRTDEDPPDDLNGDGLITMMRIPAPNVKYNLSPTHIISPDDARLMREPKPAEGELATHALLIEGIDNDGDGEFNEDGWGGASGGGVNLDMNFPTHWPEHTDGAGRYPLARTETRALVAWMQQRTNIVAVLVFGPHDTLATLPPAGKFGPDERVPLGIEDGDKPFYEALGKSFKEITSITGASEPPDLAGSLVHWAYADLGAWAFSTPAWVRPDLIKPAESDTESTGAHAEDPDPAADQPDPEQAEREALAARGIPDWAIEFLLMSPEERLAELTAFEQASDQEQQARLTEVNALPEDIRTRIMELAQAADVAAGHDHGDEEGEHQANPASESPSKKGDKKEDDSPDAKWLAWIDDQRAGEGFLAWTPFDHPQLGPIEIGGFIPGVRTNPPMEAAADTIDAQTAFVADLIAKLPNLEIDPPTIEPLGANLFRISITARNTGFLPTVPEIGRKARRLPPIVFALDPAKSLAETAFLTARRHITHASIGGSGATERAEWLITADPGASIRLEVRSPHFGNRAFDITLEQPQ